MYSDVGYCAQRTVRVSVGVRMGVRDLHGTGKDHEHDAQNREEKPPRMPCPLLPVAALCCCTKIQKAGSVIGTGL